MLRQDEIDVIKKLDISPNTLKNWVGLQAVNQANAVKIRFKTPETDNKKDLNTSKVNVPADNADSKTSLLNSKFDSIVRNLQLKIEKLEKTKLETYYMEMITDKLFYNISKLKEEITQMSSFMFKNKYEKDKIEKTLETVMAQNELIIEQLSKMELMYSEVILKLENSNDNKAQKKSYKKDT